MWSEDPNRRSYSGSRTRRTPGTAAVIVATLAIGLGGAIALFSLASSLLLRPLPYHDASQLVFVWSSGARTPRDTLTPGRLVDIREQSSAFEGIAGISQFSLNLVGAGSTERVGRLERLVGIL